MLYTRVSSTPKPKVPVQVSESLAHGELHSFEDIRNSIEQDSQTIHGIVPILEKHHVFLRASMAMILDEESTNIDKQEYLEQFIRVLEMHGKAEEATIYECLKHSENKEARIDALSAEDEHLLASQLCRELTEKHFTRTWSEEIDAKARVLCSLVEAHIEEEESMLLPTAQREISETELQNLGDAYLDFCKKYLNSEMMSPESALESSLDDRYPDLIGF